MKKIARACLTISLFAILQIGKAYALPVTNIAGDGFEDISGSAYANYANSGELMFIVNGENNDGQKFNNGIVESYIEAWLATNRPELFNISSFQLTKSESTIVSLASDGDSGTWSVVPSSNAISFYAVKADNDYAMYLVNPAESTGSWSTYDLFVDPVAHPATASSLELSHFQAYNPSPATAVPEPATMLLFGTGLVGLAGLARRKAK